MISKQKENTDGIGAPVLRKEDRRLLTGKGQYTADFMPSQTCFAYILRSPYAHAVIKNICSEFFFLRNLNFLILYFLFLNQFF